jgi:hypothetical protein
MPLKVATKSNEIRDAGRLENLNSGALFQMKLELKPLAKPELNGHGGAREGAGRKPKALQYENEIATAEAQILAALPDVIESLICRAQNGDVSAAKYLIDRVFGRIAEQAAPLADDTAIPFSEADAECLEFRADARRKQQTQDAAFGVW